jgi:hypothetical protein
MTDYKFQCPGETTGEENSEFPEDEIDYHIKISNEADRIGRAMISCKDPEEAKALNEKYVRLQNWLTEISFGNVWDD